MENANAMANANQRKAHDDIIAHGRKKASQYDYPNAMQKARLDSGLTQEGLAELIDMSPGSVKAYEAGTTRPPARVARLVADICGAPELCAMHINGDEMLGGIIPPIAAGTAEMAALRFEAARLRMDAVAREVYALADGGEPCGEYREALGELASAAIALRLCAGKGRRDVGASAAAKGKHAYTPQL